MVGIPDAICNELPAAIVMKGEGIKVTEQDIADHVKSKDSVLVDAMFV